MESVLTKNAAILFLENFAWQKKMRVVIGRDGKEWAVSIISRDTEKVIYAAADKNLGNIAKLLTTMIYQDVYKQNEAKLAV